MENQIDEPNPSIAEPMLISDTHVDNTSNEKRIRKSVSRLSEVYDKTFEQRSERNAKPVVGDGVKLGDILRIQNACHRNKITGELACNVHLLCYRTKGKAKTRLSAIKKFNGFTSNDDEYRKRIALCDKMKLDDLKLLCDLLNVHPVASGTKHKKDITISIVDYLKCPFETGSEVFRMKSLKQKTKPVKSKVPSTKSVKSKAVSKSDSDNDLNISISGSSISKKSEPSNNLVDKENNINKKKPSLKRKQSIEPKDSSKKKNPGKYNSSQENSKIKTLPAELPLQESSIQQLNTITTGGSDDFHSSSENLSDACFKEKISEILNGSDLNKITLNQVCDRVTEQFPDVDLLQKRQHIKSLVKQVIDQA